MYSTHTKDPMDEHVWPPANRNKQFTRYKNQPTPEVEQATQATKRPQLLCTYLIPAQIQATVGCTGYSTSLNTNIALKQAALPAWVKMSTLMLVVLSLLNYSLRPVDEAVSHSHVLALNKLDPRGYRNV